MIWNALFMAGCANGVTTLTAAEQPQPLELAQKHELDAFVEAALERHNVPGAACDLDGAAGVSGSERASASVL
jgi:hypothetical protein